MKWYRIAVFEEGVRQGYELVKAETAETAAEKAVEESGCVGDITTSTECLTLENKLTCAVRDEIERFVADGCTPAEAKKHIAAGSCSVPAAEWDGWAKDNAYLDEDGEPVSLAGIKKSRDVGVVTVDGMEYILLYVL